MVNLVVVTEPLEPARYYFRLRDTPTESGVSVYTERFRVIRETPKGVWIDVGFCERFILNNARKRWACPTREEAVQSYLRRKQRQVSILNNQLRNAKLALMYAEINKTRLEKEDA